MSRQSLERPTATVDPITAEIVRSALVAITDEMKTNLMRTAYNMIIYEALDFTVGLFDAEGNTDLHRPRPADVHPRALRRRSRRSSPTTARRTSSPGDILLTNDSYIMGSHLNHMIFTLPIFWQGELVAFSASMAHWQDVGGTLRGTTTDIYEEGLQMPIVKIYRQGVLNDELVEIIKTNVRFPDLAMGDFRAQIAAIKTGERRFVQLLQRYGRDAVLGSIQQIYRAQRRGGAPGRARHPGRRVRGRELHGRRRRPDRPAHPDPRARRRRRRRDDRST